MKIKDKIVAVSETAANAIRRNAKFTKALAATGGNRAGRRARAAIWRRAVRAFSNGRPLDEVSYRC